MSFTDKILAPNVGLGDLQKAQQGLRTVVASALRVSVVRASSELSSPLSVARDIDAPLWDPFAPGGSVGSLEVRASVYGNPWWEILQMTATLASIMAAVKLADGLIDIVMKIGTFPTELAERRARLRADVARSRVDEIRALVELDGLGEDLRAIVSRNAAEDPTNDSEADKEQAEGVAAMNLVEAAYAMPVSRLIAPPVLRIISEDEALGAAQTARDLAASQDLDSKSISAGEQVPGNREISGSQ